VDRGGAAIGGRLSTGRSPATDVALVGLGAAGGIAAHVLTEAGLEVVALEAGPRLDASLMTSDEIRNDVRGWLSQPKAMHEIPTWRSSGSEAAGPSPWPMLMVNAVGGSTVHYPGLSIRLNPWNFESRTRVVERYGASALPVGSTLADWPLGYTELEPYYDEVEYAIGVAGSPGTGSGRPPDPGGNQFEGPRRRDFPLPPVRRTGWTELMAGAARRLGWHPFPAPAAINSEPYNGNPECTYCGFCTANGCYRSAKGSTDANVIRRAEATGRLTIQTSARVVRLDVDAEGLVSGVTYVKDGRERFQPARAVLLGAFTYENSRLLLLSTSRAYPNGLSNKHGQVGKHFMAHVTPFAFGLFPRRRLNLFSGFWAQATCLDDWNADNFDHSGLGFVGGAMLTAPHELKPIASAGGPLPGSVPRWGTAWKAWLKEHAQSVGVVNAQLECLSYESNELDLDPVADDPYGVRVVRVTHRPGENERRGFRFMLEKLETWLLEAGASETWSTDDLFVEARHCYGGTRMGDDPDTSVVDRYGFSHEAPNLGVLGASTFPTTGGHNPTLTVQALAWRTAERLSDEWNAKAGPA
jgi:gluconate 2-dehydrogenase alpha chain